jgi:hypothetical protein
MMELGIAMKKILIFIGVFFCLGSAHAAERKLFDGRTFKGWIGDTNKTFHIQDGAIVGGTFKEKIPRNEFLCTRREYTNFILKVKFKLLGGAQANGGVQFRTQRHENDNEVSGYQADMGDPSWWGCLYDESRRNKVLAQAPVDEVKKVLKRDDWNQYEIRAEGKHIRIFLNGAKTVDYTEEDASIPDHGIIAVQIHAGPPSEAWYKDISIMELP